eukprot:jgi/Ulvmu1/5324/UM022_0118.1
MTSATIMHFDVPAVRGYRHRWCSRCHAPGSPSPRPCKVPAAAPGTNAATKTDSPLDEQTIDREIAAIALPTLATLAAEPMAALVDTMWVGRLGTAELAACAAAASVFNLATKLINMPLSAVTTSLVAAASAPAEAAGRAGSCTWQRGAGAGTAAWAAAGSAAAAAVSPAQQAAVSGALCAGLAAGVLQGVLLLWGGRAALSVWCSGAASASALVATAHLYLAVRAVGAPVNTCLMVAQAAARGVGLPRLPLRATLVANGVNLVLDPLLIFSLHWGLAGAAWATVCGQALAVLDLLWKLYGLGALGSVGSGIARSVRALLPSTSLLVLRSMAVSGTFAFATAAATRVGTVEAAAHAICFQVWLASSLLADALALAAQTLIGQSLTLQPARAAQIARRVLVLGCVLGGVLAAALLALRTQIAAAFTSDPGTHAVATRMLCWVALLQPVNALAFVWDGVLYGTAAFRYAALMMPLNVLPAVLCITAASTQATGAASLTYIWTGLGLVMLMRAVTAYLPFRMRWGTFSTLPAPAATKIAA